MSQILFPSRSVGTVSALSWLAAAVAGGWARRRFLAVPIVLLAVSCAPQPPEANALAEQAAPPDPAVAEAAVRAVLQRQQEAWNRGDIDAFMNDYVHGERLRFASGGTVRRGWATTLERYKTTYPDVAAMGQLTFSELETLVLGDAYVEVHGRWQLQRAEDTPGGRFTLLFERQAAAGQSAGEWQILHDHTSSD